MTTAAQWASQNGVTYAFTSHEFDANWNAVGGVYVFASRDDNGNWDPYYVGQADSFKDRLPYHERLGDAALAGATTVLACVVPNENERAELERDMCQRLQPILNSQLVGSRQSIW